jgi:hypothetical protein
MNIFFLDKTPTKLAMYHNDKHVVKMILETAQLLCSVHWLNGNEAPYKLTHKNHPCAVWARENIANYNLLCKIGLALCKEYTHRYDKIHKTYEVILWCIINQPILQYSKKTTVPPLVMPNEYKVDSVVESYRNYYRSTKVGSAKWTKRKIPKWAI